MEKKEYSVEELLLYTYKYNKIPSVLFAKDRDCRYIYTSEVEAAINSGEENSIIGKQIWIFSMILSWEDYFMNRIRRL
ncbi:MAG: hypothetical protein ACLT4A_12765 [Anaerobutyricum soehngenii]